MKTRSLYHSLLKERNLKEYAGLAGKLDFLEDTRLNEYLRERESLLAEIETLGAKTCFGGSKTDCRKISPGCRLCGEGHWSCLFINGICNARCFYCPSEQKEAGMPVTNTLEFPDPEGYITYLEKLGFRGVSISGGEPLLSFERSLRYIRSIRNHFGDRMYIWLYTNGILATEEKLDLLADAGLDEIRFDIGATGYRIEKLGSAARIIPVVTVEIPAVPEEYDRIKNLLPQLAASGVSYLNLHQLRLTEFNAKHLLNRSYSYLRGQKVTVAQSELTALRLILWSLEKGIDLPVNYCSFVYKNRYQGKAARRRTAGVISRSYEDITDAGFIRSLYFTGIPDDLKDAAERLRNLNGDADPGLWYFPEPGNKLFVSGRLLEMMGKTDHLTLHVRYSDTRFSNSLSYRYPFTAIQLNGTRKIFIERIQCFADYEKGLSEKELFMNLFLGSSDPGHTASTLSDIEGITLSQAGWMPSHTDRDISGHNASIFSDTSGSGRDASKPVDINATNPESATPKTSDAVTADPKFSPSLPETPGAANPKSAMVKTSYADSIDPGFPMMPETPDAANPGASGSIISFLPEFGIIDNLNLPADKKEAWIRILEFEKVPQGFQF